MCSVGDLDPCAVWDETWRAARKEHRCQDCGGVIAKGEQYLVHFSVFEGDPHSAKVCGPCFAISETFAASHTDGMRQQPGSLRHLLSECIADGDEESERVWKPMLAAMDARRVSP